MGKILAGYLSPHPPIIVSEIGRGEERKAQNTIEGVKAIAKDIKEKAPTTIIIITPHGPLFSDAVSISLDENLKGDFSKFGYGNIKLNFQNNTNLVYKIIENSLRQGITIAQVNDEFARNYDIENELDHGVLVPLYFVDKEYKNFKLIHITYGLLSPRDLYKFGQIVKKVIEEDNEDAVVIASGDLSHKLSNQGPYLYSPHGKIFDEKIVDILSNADMKSLVTFDLSLGESAGECGLRSLIIMAGMLDRYDLKSQVFSYEGPFGVGYCTAKLDVIGEKEMNLIEKIEEEEKRRIKDIREKEDEYVRLARMSLEHFVNTGEYMQLPKDISPELINVRKPVFVTIKKNGMLRGCIGSTEAREKNIATEIIKYAVNAGMKDPRFESISKEELDELTYSVDVLERPEAITSKDKLDVSRYGVIVNKGFRTGLLLPNIEGVDTVEEQIEIALRKAGIRENENYSMERFEVIRHH